MNSYVVDTNVLLRRAERQHLASSAIEILLRRVETLCLTPQVLMEYWNVATRPESVNGLGLMPDNADRLLSELEPIFELLPETARVYPIWRGLVRSHAVSGRQVHDAHLVASMLSCGVTRLLTFNDVDFSRYTEITTLHPASVTVEQAGSRCRRPILTEG